MRRPCLLIALAPVALGLVACDKSDNAPGPGGVTVGEARALDEAAEMIDKRRLPAEALRSPAPAATPAPSVAASTAP